MATAPRPQRTRIPDEAGRVRTLMPGADAFTVFGSGPEPIFLGLGPDPASAAALLAPGQAAAYIECQAFADHMSRAWLAAIPPNWTRLSPNDLTPDRAAQSRFYLYRQNPRLFPSFWGPIWAKVQLALLPPVDRAAPSATVLLARPTSGLLEQELARAFTACGRTVADIPPEAAARAVRDILARSGRPELFCCVNAACLDDDGLVFSLLAEAGVPVAVWCVDNPFHIISRLRAPFWKKTHLFVTDDWFVAPLTDLGAASVHHLPLAAASHFFGAAPEPALAGRLLFVGRSQFPGRDGFFAGCRVPPEAQRQAQAMLEQGQRPDFGWWLHRLSLDAPWPGKAVRQAGLGAEEAGRAWRTAVLAALAREMPLTIFGDAHWRELVSQADVRGPVDYYGPLPGLYAGADLTLNLTSLLLPRGLTQRHFDVWAAGGVLVTDATPGLDLFPAKLTASIAFDRPSQALARAKALMDDAALRVDLTAAWQELMSSRHTYEERMAQLLDMATAARIS